MGRDPCIAVLLLACPATACVEDRHFFAASSKLTLAVTLDESGVRVKTLSSGRERTAPAPITPSWLTFEFRDPGGHVLRAGRVPDPRVQRIEWEQDDALRGSTVNEAFGAFVVTVPESAGDLVVFEPGPDGALELGRARIDPAPSAHELALTEDQEIGELQSVVFHGTLADSVNLLFLPEGYPPEQLVEFHRKVFSIASVLEHRPDWGRHWGAFNVLIQDVPSVDSGVDDHRSVGDADTAFDFELRPIGGERSGDMAHCETPEAAQLIERLGSEARADLVVMVVNGQRAFRSTAGTHVVLYDESRPDVIAHELGHALAHLKDEYEEAAPCNPAMQGANVSLTTDRAAIPWADLIDPSTPVPTPIGLQAIGAHPGAMACRGAFRPTPDCLMRSNSAPACRVCQGAIDAMMIAGVGTAAGPGHPGGAGAPDPEAWTCDLGYRDSRDGCDCGCGAADPDCGDGGCVTPGCRQAACAFCFDAAGELMGCVDPANAPGDSPYDSQDPCAAYDWVSRCVDGDDKCHEADGCCWYDSDNHDGGPCWDGVGGLGVCDLYDRSLYCVDGDTLCHEGDGCCDQDADCLGEADAGDCSACGTDVYVADEAGPCDCPETWRVVTLESYWVVVSQVCRDGAWLTFDLDPRDPVGCCGGDTWGCCRDDQSCS